MTGSAVFLDTSIQIARFFHAPEMKEKIESTLSRFNISATSLVVKQEFKRRVLKEVRYLLSLFARHKSFNKVRRHVDSQLQDPRQKRKQAMCLHLLDTIGETDAGPESDADRTDRAVLLLELLMEEGLADFENSVDHIFIESGCACATEPVRSDRIGHVDFGIETCSKAGALCGVAAFLASNKPLLRGIAEGIRTTESSKLTEELRKIGAFIDDLPPGATGVESKDPCKTVGDLLIAIESKSVRTFYTINRKESEVLCRCLGQELIFRPAGYDHDDEITDFRNSTTAK